MKDLIIRVPTAFAFGLAVGALVFSMQARAQSGFPAPANPPNNNVAAPIHVGYAAQAKEGRLLVRGLISNGVPDTNGFLVEYGNVGIGTLAPTAKLDVNGTIKIRGGTPGGGKVLTSDATGLASWQPPPSVSVSAVDYFEIDIPRFGTAVRGGASNLTSSGGIVTNSYTTTDPYTFCALARIGDDFANSDNPGSECRVLKNGNDTWTIKGSRGDDPAFWCSMYCFQ